MGAVCGSEARSLSINPPLPPKDSQDLESRCPSLAGASLNQRHPGVSGLEPGSRVFEEVSDLSPSGFRTLPTMAKPELG